MITPELSYREIHPVADHLKAEKGRKYDREYYAKNRQYFSEKSRIYREKNKEAISERGRVYRLSNKERVKETKHAYWEANKEKINAQESRNRLTNGEAIRAKDRKYYAENRDREVATKRRSSFKTKYGMTVSDWEALFLSQGNRCAICRSTDSGPRYWHVDHHHKSGVVRGILCHHCNLMLGQARDKIEVLHAAISYLNGSVEAV